VLTYHPVNWQVNRHPSASGWEFDTASAESLAGDSAKTNRAIILRSCLTIGRLISRQKEVKKN